MNKNTNESWNYAKYRTICILSEEMIREYGRAAWMEKADELYEKVKEKIMELPIAEAEKQMKQVDVFFQSILEGKTCTIQTAPVMEKKVETVATPSQFNVVKTNEEKNENYTSKILFMINNPEAPYSDCMKRDEATFRKVRKHFLIKEESRIYCFFDYTVFGGCKEGVAICSDGIYFRTLAMKVRSVLWCEINQYDVQLSGAEDRDFFIKKKDENTPGQTVYFLRKPDGENVVKMIKEVQKLLKNEK